MSSLPEDFQNLFVDDVNILPVTGVDFNTMSKREFEIATTIGLGYSNKKIGITLGITKGTVKVYLSRLFPKLDVSNRFELAELVNNRCEEFISAKSRLDKKLEKRHSSHKN